MIILLPLFIAGGTQGARLGGNVLAVAASSPFANSAQNGAVLFLRAACVVRETIPLVDLLPEPAAIRNVWENKLALVESEGVGAIVATER